MTRIAIGIFCILTLQSLGPRKPAPAEIVVRVTDSATNRPIPCRLTITDSHGELGDIACERSVRTSVRKGVISSATGEAQFTTAPGRYVVFAGHGPEYGLARQEIDAADKPITLSLKLTHEVVAT